MKSPDWPDLYETNDYLRRIHWWVRLFGIFAFVVPVLAALAAVAFVLAALAMGG